MLPTSAGLLFTLIALFGCKQHLSIRKNPHTLSWLLRHIDPKRWHSTETIVYKLISCSVHNIECWMEQKCLNYIWNMKASTTILNPSLYMSCFIETHIKDRCNMKMEITAIYILFKLSRRYLGFERLHFISKILHRVSQQTCKIKMYLII